MKNLIIIQHEDLLRDPYIFIDDERFDQSDKVVGNLVDKAIYSKDRRILLKRMRSSGIDIYRRLSKGYLIEGVLTNKDEAGRRMSFTCFYIGSPNEFKGYLESNLLKINKNIALDHLQIIENTLKRYFLLKKMIIIMLTIGIIYLILR